jgi:hypothetical protein
VESSGKIYRNTVFRIVRAGFLIGCVIFLIFSVLAIANLVFDLGWGYPWQAIPSRFVMALGSYGGYLATKKMSEVISRVRD